MTELSVSCAYANFSHFYLGVFYLRIFCLELVIETLKKVFNISSNNSVKM